MYVVSKRDVGLYNYYLMKVKGPKQLNKVSEIDRQCAFISTRI